MIAHLHTHTHYSILDGAMTVRELIDKAYMGGIDAIAVTEHSNIFSAVEFFTIAKEVGIKPIIGCELYMAPKSRFDKGGRNYHLTLLVMNDEGYRNLCQILTRANFEGFFRRPRADIELLSEYSEGLICLSGCLKGEIPSLILAGEYDKALERIKLFREIFKDRFYLEIQENGLLDQIRINETLAEISRTLGIKIVATGDSHYIEPGGWEIQDALLAIRDNTTLDDPKRLRYETRELWLYKADEIRERFKWIPQAIDVHEEIVKMCNFEFKVGKIRLPSPIEELVDDNALDGKLEEMAKNGLVEKLKEKKAKAEVVDEEVYILRLKNELEVIKSKGFAKYFLIVKDFIDFARSRRIPVGPGRGSAAGSLVSWALNITSLDPIKYGLIFERFLNPERVKPPDIDVDFCKFKRDEVTDYVNSKYGSERVAHVITFGTIGARQAIRDAGRILGMPASEVDEVSKLIPQEPGRKITLDNALDEVPRLKELLDGNPRIRKLLNLARNLEGKIRQVGVHASGFVISDAPLTEYMPLLKRDQEITTHYDMDSLAKLGLVKFDFLGLETLTLINKVVEAVGTDMDKIPLDDENTYKLLSSGDTLGVFQFESPGMKELLVRLKPKKFEELIAAVALYRPGPIQSGMVDEFIRRRDEGKAEYPHPDLEPILKETYGLFLYQEQVMFSAALLAGLTMGEADILREAMGKKKSELMRMMKSKFIEGAKKKMSEEHAVKIFEIMEKFAEYAFNKSHSTAYAYIAYLTAYLKANYPLEFSAALLTSEMRNSEKLTFYLRSLMDNNVKIFPPCVNKSFADFRVEEDGIRFGLGGVKNVGGKAVEKILAERVKLPFRSVRDFLARTKVNRKVAESLVKAGAFDSLGISRQEAMQAIGGAERIVQELFAAKGEQVGYKNIEDIMKQEEEVLGIVFSEPEYITTLKSIKDFFPVAYNGISQVAGIPLNPSEHRIGEKTYCIFYLNIGEKRIEVVLEGKHKVHVNKIIVVSGKPYGTADLKQITERFIASDINPLDEIGLTIVLRKVDKKILGELKMIMSTSKSAISLPCFIVVEESGSSYDLSVKAPLSRELKDFLESVDIQFILTPLSR